MARVVNRNSVLANRLAVTTSINDNATCRTTTGVPPPTRRSPDALRPCSFSASNERPLTLNAGATPNRQRRSNAHADRKSQHAPVERHVEMHAVAHTGKLRDESAASPPRKQQSEGRTRG